MKRREFWGVALLAGATVVAGCGFAVDSADRAAADQGLLLYVGVRASTITYRLMILASFLAAAGLVLLIPSLIGRISRKVLRRTVGWATALTAAAALPYLGITLIFAFLGAVGIGDDVKVVATDGTNVLVSQDGFDGDSVDIYTEHDEYHYKWVHRAYELGGGWPRVKDQNCRVEAAAAGSRLTCGGTSVDVGQEE